jgi:S1-C subfamily serine protease
VGQFLRDKGSRPLLGVVVQPVVLERGIFALLVLEVADGGPADRASVLPGDVLTGAGGECFRSVNDLRDAIEQSGGVLRLQFLRGDRRAQREVSVSLRAIGAAA